MKKIFYPFLMILAVGVFFQSCEDDFDLAPDAPDLFDTRGAVVSLTSPSPDFFDTGAPDAPVTFEVTTKGEPVTSVKVLKNFNETGAIEHATLTSFPATISVSLNDALAGTGQAVEDMKVGDSFVLTFEVTTASGTYRSGANVLLAVSCSTKVPGTYDFVSSDYWCDGDPVSGTVTITETETAGTYTFDDWSFGTYGSCYGGAASDWGSLAFVRYTDASCDECNQSELCNTISITGEDFYGDTWTFTIDGVDGSDLTMTWGNTYGESGTVVLTRPDGSNWPPLK